MPARRNPWPCPGNAAVAGPSTSRAHRHELPGEVAVEAQQTTRRTVLDAGVHGDRHTRSSRTPAHLTVPDVPQRTTHLQVSRPAHRHRRAAHHHRPAAGPHPPSVERPTSQPRRPTQEPAHARFPADLLACCGFPSGGFPSGGVPTCAKPAIGPKRPREPAHARFPAVLLACCGIRCGGFASGGFPTCAEPAVGPQRPR